MVELKVDLVDESLMKDCFVSVRVGDTQKLSRVTNSRSYKFPQAGDRRYGKIEVYRRVGSCGVDIDPQNEGARQVAIGCGDNGVLKLNVEVAADAKTGAKKQEAALEASSPSGPQKGDKSKSQAAKDYLRKHSLEMQLAEAMQAVLREKPENPVKFLAEKLLSNLSDGGVALVPPTPAKVGKSSKKAAERAPAPEPKAAPVPTTAMPAPVAILPFGQYARTHFATVPRAAFDHIYAKFPGPKKPAKVVTHKASVVAKAALGDIYAKFPAAATPEAEPAPLATSAAPSVFGLLPSVGTWLAPARKLPAAPAPAPAAPAPAPAPAAAAAPAPATDTAAPAGKTEMEFHTKPSVGTWYMRPQKSEAPAAKVKLDLPAPAADYPLPEKKAKFHAVSSGVFGPQHSRLGLRPTMLFI